MAKFHSFDPTANSRFIIFVDGAILNVGKGGGGVLTVDRGRILTSKQGRALLMYKYRLRNNITMFIRF